MKDVDRNFRLSSRENGEEYIAPPTIDPIDQRKIDVTINYATSAQARIFEGVEPGYRITVDPTTAEKINKAQEGLDSLFLIPDPGKQNTFMVKYSRRNLSLEESDFGVYLNPKGERCIKLPKDAPYRPIVTELLSILPEPLDNQEEFDNNANALFYRPKMGERGQNTLYCSPSLYHVTYTKKAGVIFSETKALGLDKILVQALEGRIMISTGRDLARRIREKLQEFSGETPFEKEEEEDGVFIFKASTGSESAGTYLPTDQTGAPKPDEIGLSFHGVDTKLASFVRGLLSPNQTINSDQVKFDQTKGTDPTAMYTLPGSDSIYVSHNFRSEHQVSQKILEPTLPPVLGPYDFQFFCTVEQGFRLYLGSALQELIKEMNPSVHGPFHIDSNKPYITMVWRTMTNTYPLHMVAGRNFTKEDKRCLAFLNTLADIVQLEHKSGSYLRAFSPSTTLAAEVLEKFRGHAEASETRTTSPHSPVGLDAESTSDLPLAPARPALAPAPAIEEREAEIFHAKLPHSSVALPRDIQPRQDEGIVVDAINQAIAALKGAQAKVKNATFRMALEQVLKLLDGLNSMIVTMRTRKKSKVYKPIGRVSGKEEPSSSLSPGGL